jgi:hypothetical protein
MVHNGVKVDYLADTGYPAPLHLARKLGILGVAQPVDGLHCNHDLTVVGFQICPLEEKFQNNFFFVTDVRLTGNLKFNHKFLYTRAWRTGTRCTKICACRAHWQILVSRNQEKFLFSRKNLKNLSPSAPKICNQQI